MTERAGRPFEPAAGPPTCYRHPQRETYLRCSRCDRPICPDCMTPAAVGQHCPVCVAEGRCSTPVTRTALGGRLSARAGLVTRALIAINVLVFLAQQASSEVTLRGEMIPGGLINFSGGRAIVPGVATGEYYRLITAAFLHGGVLHIAFNMFALYVIGSQLEPLLGTARYLTLYVLSAVGGNVLSYLIAPANLQAVGASGAIFGLFAALFVIGRRLRLDVTQIAVYIGLNLVLTFTLSNIDWRAHVGGLVTGAIVSAAYAYAPRARRDAVAVSASAAMAVVLVVLVAFRTAALGV